MYFEACGYESSFDHFSPKYVRSGALSTLSRSLTLSLSPICQLSGVVSCTSPVTGGQTTIDNAMSVVNSNTVNTPADQPERDTKRGKWVIDFIGDEDKQLTIVLFEECRRQ